MNLTQMCKANGKKLSHFLALKETKSYIKVMERDAGIPASEIIRITKGGDPKSQGSWGHPEIGILLTEWISPEFHRWSIAHIFVLIKDGVTKLDQNPFERMMEIMAEDYNELDKLMPNDDRFGDSTQYSNWSLYSEDY